MKHQKLTENEARRLGDAIAAEARALGFVGKEKKCRRKQSAASGRGYLGFRAHFHEKCHESENI